MFEFIKELFTPAPKYIKYYVSDTDITNVIGWFKVNAKDLNNLPNIISKEMKLRTGADVRGIFYGMDGWGRDLYRVQITTGHLYIIANSRR